MNRIFVSINENMEQPDWLESTEVFLEKAMKELNYDGEEVSVLFCDDEYIHELNKVYRGIDSATDVLSFENEQEYEDEEGHWKCMGDIVISLDTLPVNADYFNVNNDSELKRLLVHGLLHLNGMDHGEEHLEDGKKPECGMLVIQENLLEKLKDEKIIK